MSGVVIQTSYQAAIFGHQRIFLFIIHLQPWVTKSRKTIKPIQTENSRKYFINFFHNQPEWQEKKNYFAPLFDKISAT